jgi:hypothetical protein
MRLRGAAISESSGSQNYGRIFRRWLFSFGLPSEAGQEIRTDVADKDLGPNRMENKLGQEPGLAWTDLTGM